MRLHYNLKVIGRVQGVFFRVSTQKEAIRLGIRGFVRNEPDGSVYIEAEGDRFELEQLLDWIRAGGPPHGIVHDLQIEKGDLLGFKGFKIK